MPIPYTAPGNGALSGNGGLPDGLLLMMMFGLGALCVGSGVWQFSLSLEELWKRHERGLLARGVAPQRSKQWEHSARVSAWACIVLGAFFWAICLSYARHPTTPPKMSGVFIEGHELSQEQWNSCHQNIAECVSIELTRKNEDHSH